MKTIAINEINKNNNQNNVSFKGHNAYLTDTGFKRHKFFLPFDSNKYDAYIEFKGFTQENGEWIATTQATTVPLPPEGINVRNNTLFSKSDATGYRFVLKEKTNPSNKFYKIDAGILSNPLAKNAESNFSILLNNRTISPENKLTKQVMPDLLPGFSMKQYNDATYELNFEPKKRLEALNMLRNHGNKLGGNFAGIIKMLPVWKREGYTKLVGTPFTKDEVSSHLYWTENPYQISNNLGTLEDFKTLQIELFKNGMNFIADGAFVNQGIQGVMFRNLLKHGSDSPFLHWFKAPGLIDGDLKLGAIPNNPKAREHFRFRLVNLPVRIVEREGFLRLVANTEYNSKKPSYIQLYDKRLVKKDELYDYSDLLTKYASTPTKNPYEIVDHEDLTQLLAFEVNPKSYSEKIKKIFDKLPKTERTYKNTDLIENLLKFPNFSLTTKDKGGIDLWDGNMDIAKLNFYIGNTDQKVINKSKNIADRISTSEQMNKSVYEVQDFTLKAGKYWTKLVADAQFEYVLGLFKDADPTTMDYMRIIRRNVQNGNLPKKTEEVITEDVVKNVIKRMYVSPYTRPKMESVHNELVEMVRKNVMETPFAMFEFSPDLGAVFASPLISRYARNEDELNQSRYEEHITDYTHINHFDKSNAYRKMNNYLFDELSPFINDVICKMNVMKAETEPYNLTNDLNVLDVTEIGYYMLPIIIPDLVKYVIAKSMNPKAEIYVNDKTGQMRITPKSFSDVSLKSLGISGSPEEEASAVVDVLKKGTKNLEKNGEKDKLAKLFLKRIENISLDKIKMAEAIIDRTQAGLGWRIDAAKDIGNIDALRSGNDNDEELLNKLNDFWGKFNDTVKSVNRNAYTTAEITDFDVVVKTKTGEFKNPVDAEAKFIERSGLNNTANYMFFFSLLRDLFAFDAEGGFKKGEFNNIESLKDKLIKGWNDECHGFLYQYPDDSIANSYTFVGNHDKPRVLHLFALDMNLFHSDFSSSDHIDRAAKVLNCNVEDIDIGNISNKAISMGEKLREAFKDCGLFTKEIETAIAQLASGNYKGEKFNAEAFGARDFRFVVKDVFDVAMSLGYKPKNRKKETAMVIETILAPSMDKMESVYKMLVTLPGSPTDFVGDKEGSSGYETKSNNVFQQNRNIVPFEWANGIIKYQEFNGDERKFVENYYANMTKIGRLRNKKELSALKAGDTVTLPLQDARAYSEDGTKLYDTKVAATFRYDDTGSQVICLYTTAGADGKEDNKTKMVRPRVDMDKIILNDDSNWKCGLKGGLKVGDYFKNENDPRALYKVYLENGQYVLRRINNNNNLKNTVSILPKDKNTAILYKCNVKQQETIPAQFSLYR